MTAILWVVAAQASLASTAPIPANVRAELLVKATAEASGAGDAHPYDISAVLTTAKEYLRITGGSWSWIAPGTPYYVVAMRGRFTSRLGPPAGGAAPSPLPVLVAAFYVPSLQNNEGTALTTRYPDLKKAGVPVRLG